MNLRILLYIGLLVFCFQGCTVPNQPPATPSSPAAIDKKALVDKVENCIDLATQAIEQKRWEQANTYLKNGLALLGDHYSDPKKPSIDDSGMHLLVADMQEKEGNLENAARNRLRFLKGRLEIFKAKPD
jgi:hypothetical protein